MPKTCIRGHEVTGKNAMLLKNGRVYCRTCHYAATAKWATKHTERLRVLKREAQARFRLSKPERVREIRRLSAKRTGDEVRRERYARWATRNLTSSLERRRENARRSRATNPEAYRSAQARRRTKKAGNGGSHTSAEWLALGWRCGWICLYCGKQLTPKSAQREHKVPIARGGSNAIENIAVSCATCNKSKGAKTVEEFRRAAP